MSLQIEECPYCDNETLYIWPEYDLVKCVTGSCNFGERSIDELEEIRQADYEDEHADTIEMMTSYDKGKLP